MKEERGGGNTEEIDVSAATLPERERKKEGGEKKSLMSFPQVFRFLCKTVNLVKFIFFAASVFYKGSFNLFLLCPVGDPHSFFFFFLPLLCSTIFSPPFCLSLPFSFLLFFFLSLSISSPCGSECFNNDTWGNWDGRTAFSSCSLQDSSFFSSALL